MWQHQWGGEGMVSSGDSPLLPAACYQRTKVEYLQALVYMKGPTKMSWQQDYRCLVRSSLSLEAIGSAWSQEAIKLLEQFEENCGFSCLTILVPLYG